MFEFLTVTLLFLVAAAFLAGVIDSIAGGGGLITVPALLMAGASPLETLGTNKLQSCFGAGTAAIAYARGGHVRPRAQLGPAALALVASMAGAFLAHVIPPGVLRIIMPVVLIIVAGVFALRRDLSDADRVPRLKPALFALIVVPAVAAYDGFFGPGAGSFYMFGFVLLTGFSMLKATAHTKLLNFASNVGALLVFAPGGAVWWGTGLAMALAEVAGALVGARLAMRAGARLIRPLLVVVSSAMALRLLWQALFST